MPAATEIQRIAPATPKTELKGVVSFRLSSCKLGALPAVAMWIRERAPPLSELRNDIKARVRSRHSTISLRPLGEGFALYRRTPITHATV